MLNNQNLTQEQQNLYNKLRAAIADRRNIGDILKAASVDDLSRVLTTTYTKQYGDLRHTLTLFGFVVYRPTSSVECVNSIFTYSQRHGILQDILVAENTLRYMGDNSTYTLTPLGLAIHLGYDKYINSILTKAQESSILKDVLGAKNTLHYGDNSTHTLTPLGLAIHQDRDKYINPILTKAQESDILKEVLDAQNTLWLPNNQNHTLTPLGLAIHLRSNELTDSILTKAQECGIQQEVLDARNVLRSSDNTYTLNNLQLSQAVNGNKTDIKSRLDNVSISPRLQENSRT